MSEFETFLNDKSLCLLVNKVNECVYELFYKTIYCIGIVNKVIDVEYFRIMPCKNTEDIGAGAGNSVTFQFKKQSKQQSNKPPLGIIPEWLHNENRLEELTAAVKRYKDADMEVPKEWIDEQLSLWNKILEHRNKQQSNKAYPVFIEEGFGYEPFVFINQRWTIDKEANYFNSVKYFDTEEAAKEYILYNKPVLSLNDVLNLIQWKKDAKIFNEKYIELKQLAQNKINNK